MKPINNLLQKQFGRLTVLERADNPGTRKNDTAAYWKCLCECGKIAIIRGYSLTSGKTKSCGCLKAEAPHLPFLKESQPKYLPEIASAHCAWAARYKELSFEDFYKLSQLPCFYCGSSPTLTKTSKRKDSAIFYYNTLDRIDSNKDHTIDNVVPSCLICNRAKLSRSLQDFYLYINNLINNLKTLSIEEYRKSLCNIKMPLDIYSYKLTAIKCIYSDYHDGKLDFEQFYQLVTAKCYYCGADPSNTRNLSNKQSSQKAKNEGTFIYNGLDRINNNLPHDYENVVPCCKYCNSAKMQLSLEDFYSWINKLAKFNS